MTDRCVFGLAAVFVRRYNVAGIDREAFANAQSITIVCKRAGPHSSTIIDISNACMLRCYAPFKRRRMYIFHLPPLSTQVRSRYRSHSSKRQSAKFGFASKETHATSLSMYRSSKNEAMASEFGTPAPPKS